MTHLKTVSYFSQSPPTQPSVSPGHNSLGCRVILAFRREKMSTRGNVSWIVADIENTNKYKEGKEQYSEIDLVGPRLFDATCQSLLKIETMKLTVA